MLSWTGAGHQNLLLNLLKIYKTNLWNFWKHPTKPLWMKYIYKITFWQSTIYLKCLLVSLCTLMKTINIHHILTNISNLFWQFNEYPTRLACSKNFFLPWVNSSQGQCSLKFIGPKVWSEIPDHIKFRSYFDFKHLHKITYSLGLLVQINKRNLFKLLYCPSLWFVEFFHYVLLDILYLTHTAKLPFIVGLIFFMCLSFDIFHLAVFFVI